MLDTNLNHFKSVFAYQFLVAPADQNYFLARFTKIYGMHTEFWWQSLQAVEKTLKAGLILNGKSVKGISHDVETLWDEHLRIFGDHAVNSLSKPEKLNHKFWHDFPLKHLISRINQMGQPDARYGLVSYSNSEDDLPKLDQLFYELRRRTIGLDWIVGEDWEDENLREFYGQPYSEVLKQRPSYQIRKIKIPEGKFATIGTNLEDIHHSWNLAFLRADEDIEKPAPPTVAPVLAGFGNSFLYLLFEELNKRTIDQPVREKVCWLLKNIKVGKQAEEEIKGLIYGRR